jgi:hypothetical protein
MIYKIKEETYEAIKSAVFAGDLDSFSFQYVHKGVEFSMESKTDNLDYDEWEDMLLEFYFKNELPEVIGFYPRIIENQLVIKASCSVFLNYNGELRNDWEMDELRKVLGSELVRVVGSEIADEDMMLYLTMSAQEGNMGAIESYSFYCINPETDEEFDLSDNQVIKDLVKVYVYEWANGKCYMGSGPTYCFFIEISESTVGEFYENYSGIVELSLV